MSLHTNFDCFSGQKCRLKLTDNSITVWAGNERQRIELGALELHPESIHGLCWLSSDDGVHARFKAGVFPSLNSLPK